MGCYCRAHRAVRDPYAQRAGNHHDGVDVGLRVIRLEVDAEHIDAVTKAGLLTITLPKRAEAKAKKIEVKVK